MIPGIVAGGLRNKLAIENLVPLGLDKSTAYYRFREDRAYSYGPPALGEVPYLNTLRIWEAFQQDDEIILKTSDTETSLVTGISNKLNNLSFTFDQNGFPLIVWEYNKEIYLRWYDPVANDTVTTNLGAGYSPFIALETFNENLKPERTILLAHIDENLNLVHRLQDDRWVEAYLIKENVKDIIGFGTTNYNNIKLVYVNDKDINDEYVIEFIATDRLGLYEFDTLYARSIVAELNAVTYVDSTVQTIGYELPLSIEVDNVESSIGQFKTYTNIDYPDIHELPLGIDVSNVQSAITVKTIGYQRIYPNDFAENKLEVIPEILSMDIRNSSIVSTLEDFAENKLEVIPEIQNFDISPGYVHPENESRYSEWSWMNKNSDIVLSNDRITSLIPSTASSDVDGIVKSVVTRGSYRKYVELKIISLGSSDTCSVGIALSDASLDDLATRNSHTWELFSDGNSIHSGGSISTAPYEEGDIIGIALNVDSGMIWWSINGVWLDSGDPENDTNPFYTGLGITDYNIISSPNSPGTRIELCIPEESWTYTIPDGYESWLENTISQFNIVGTVVGGGILESYNIVLDSINNIGDVEFSIIDSTAASGDVTDWTDPYWEHVVALLHFDGPDGSTTFTDETGKVWTPSGNAQIDTAQSMFGSASGLFDGSGDALTTPASADFNLFGGDMTIEFFFRPVSTSGNQCLIQLGSSVTNRANVSLVNNITFYTQVPGAGSQKIVATAPSAGVWHHCALVRSGGLFTMYVDGVSVGTSSTSEYPTGSLQGHIGSNNFEAASYYNGHIDELRITKGAARYTANFTPPDRAFPDQ